jgi:hypothetical protein
VCAEVSVRDQHFIVAAVRAARAPREQGQAPLARSFESKNAL